MTAEERGTPRHRALLHAAFGDYQVANVAAEVEARTVGAALLESSVPERHWGRRPVVRVRAHLQWTGRRPLVAASRLCVRLLGLGQPGPAQPANVPPEA